jgi:phasin family protein|tara:strand:+ start:1162 stop:1650 length:489 start_codon:yes stop_codon:yes gene_type:complete
MTTQKTATGNPFFDFDVTKVMAEFDPAKYAGEFAKIADRYNVPGFDVTAVLEAQRRNVEALTAANQAATEGVRALAKRQSEILQQSLDAGNKAFAKLGEAGSPRDAAANQAQIAKQVFDKAVANTGELTALVAKTNAEAAEVITARIAEGLDEIQEQAETLK